MPEFDPEELEISRKLQSRVDQIKKNQRERLGTPDDTRLARPLHCSNCIFSLLDTSKHEMVACGAHQDFSLAPDGSYTPSTPYQCTYYNTEKVIEVNGSRIITKNASPSHLEMYFRTLQKIVDPEGYASWSGKDSSEPEKIAKIDWKGAIADHFEIVQGTKDANIAPAAEMDAFILLLSPTSEHKLEAGWDDRLMDHYGSIEKVPDNCMEELRRRLQAKDYPPPTYDEPDPEIYEQAAPVAKEVTTQIQKEVKRIKAYDKDEFTESDIRKATEADLEAIGYNPPWIKRRGRPKKYSEEVEAEAKKIIGKMEETIAELKENGTQTSIKAKLITSAEVPGKSENQPEVVNPEPEKTYIDPKEDPKGFSEMGNMAKRAKKKAREDMLRQMAELLADVVEYKELFKILNDPSGWTYETVMEAHALLAKLVLNGKIGDDAAKVVDGIFKSMQKNIVDHKDSITNINWDDLDDRTVVEAVLFLRRNPVFGAVMNVPSKIKRRAWGFDFEEMEEPEKISAPEEIAPAEMWA